MSIYNWILKDYIDILKLNTALTYSDIQIVPTVSDINSRSECSLKSKLFHDIELDIPIISSPMDTVTSEEVIKILHENNASSAMHRFCSIDEAVDIARKFKNIPTIVHSIGTIGDWQDRALALYENGATSFLIEVANGGNQSVVNVIKYLKSLDKSIRVMAGNICEPDAAELLIKAGVDSLRVGIGNGSVCSTRIETGIGVPQFTALASIINKRDSLTAEIGKYVTIVADGGIKEPGDCAKALALGADVIMLGSMIASTSNAPGIEEGASEKVYRGSASAETKKTHNLRLKNVEGVAANIKITGTLKDLINRLEDGIQSSMSYVGARTIEEFREYSRFCMITTNGRKEATPHINS